MTPSPKVWRHLLTSPLCFIHGSREVQYIDQKMEKIGEWANRVHKHVIKAKTSLTNKYF